MNYLFSLFVLFFNENLVSSNNISIMSKPQMSMEEVLTSVAEQYFRPAIRTNTSL